MQNYRTISVPNRYRSTPQKPSSSRVGKKRLLLLAALIVAGFSGSHLYGWGGSDQGNSKAAAAVVPAISQQSLGAMSAQINAVIAGHPSMEVSVAISDLSSGQNYHYGLSDPYIAASISKVLTACLFLHQVEGGKHSLSENVNGNTAKYELAQMIEQSDNDAWAAFNGLLTHDSLKAYAASLSLKNYDPDENTLTADDISLLLSKIYKHELLNSVHTSLLLSYMHSANEDGFIVNSVPDKVKVYHKAGWLEDRINDAAIIDNGLHPYTLVIFTKDDSGGYDSDQGHQIFADITQASVKSFVN